MICPHPRLVDAPVAIGIFQQFDGTVLSFFCLLDRLVTSSDPPHLLVELTGLVQLDHVQVAFQVVAMDLANQDASFRVERHGNRVGQIRFAGDQLHVESWLRAKQLAALLGRQC